MLRRATQTIAFLIVMQAALLNTLVATAPALAMSADVNAPIFLHSPNTTSVKSDENEEIIATVTKTVAHTLPHTNLNIT